MAENNIYQKLHIIQTKIVALEKDSKAFGFNYVGGNKLLGFIKPLMNELGLLLKQEITSIDNTLINYTLKNGKEKTEILSKVMMRFTWVDIETKETDVNEFGANGQNDFEKGLGSALTYGERYFFMKYFHIPTDKDDVDNPHRVNTGANNGAWIKKIKACKTIPTLLKLYQDNELFVKSNLDLVQEFANQKELLNE